MSSIWMLLARNIKSISLVLLSNLVLPNNIDFNIEIKKSFKMLKLIKHVSVYFTVFFLFISSGLFDALLVAVITTRRVITIDQFFIYRFSRLVITVYGCPSGKFLSSFLESNYAFWEIVFIYCQSTL